MQPGQVGPDDGALNNAVALAATIGTAQLVIARTDKTLVECSFDPDPVDVYAVQKGLVSVLFCVAEAQGLLHLDDPVSAHLGPGWTELPAASEARLRIDTVLNMTTGMDDELRPLGEVGVTWRYNNIAYNYLKTVLESVTGRSMDEISKSWLFEPLGMTSSRWVDRQVMRPDGQPVTGLLSTAHDLARFGMMVLTGGGDVVPADHLRLLGRPGSVENPAWGLCWWNNDQAHHRLPRSPSEQRPGRITPEAPEDLIAARGAVENRLYLVPSLDLVVARTAKPVGRHARPEPFDRPFWQTLTPG
ncbi:MAG: serine hydrolase [Actinomycetota bacterium]